MRWNYTIHYSKRKSMALRILPDASIEVRCPLGTSKDTVAQFVQSKQEWLFKNVPVIKAICQNMQKTSAMVIALSGM